MCDCQGLGLVARVEAPILVFDTKQVLYWPVLGQIQFCNAKPVLILNRFCIKADFVALHTGPLWEVCYEDSLSQCSPGIAI